MDKIEKFLKKLNSKERERILMIIQLVLANQLQDLEVTKLQGYSKLFRIKENNIRIVFEKQSGRNVIKNVDFRKDVYKDY